MRLPRPVYSILLIAVTFAAIIFFAFPATAHAGYSSGGFRSSGSFSSGFRGGSSYRTPSYGGTRGFSTRPSAPRSSYKSSTKNYNSTTVVHSDSGMGSMFFWLWLMDRNDSRPAGSTAGTATADTPLESAATTYVWLEVAVALFVGLFILAVIIGMLVL